MSHGAHVEASPDDGITALRVAIRNGYETVVYTLLKHGADIEATDSPVDKTLLAAASHDRPETILALCDAGANVSGKDCHGRMVLYRVPTCGLSWAVEKLLERGFRCDVQDDCGETSQHNALFQADHRTAKKLIEWKTPIVWANERLSSPLDLEDAADHTLRTREQDIVQPPLDHGSKLEARDTGGWRPLHKAIISQPYDSVENLLNASARIGARTTPGMTALHYAIEWEDEGILEVLLQYNPPVNAQNNAGWTALHAAVSGNKAGITKRLLDAAADLYTEDAWGERRGLLRGRRATWP